MKNMIKKRIDLLKIYKSLVGILSVVLIFSANATTCHIIHQPEEPQEIELFVQKVYQMIDKLSERIAQNLLTAQALDEKDINLYQYAIQVLICTLLNYSAFVVIGIIFGMFWENFIMIVPFSLIRKFTGGYHANKYRNCFIGSIAIDIMCLLIIRNIIGVGLYVFGGITIISFILICIFSPVEHKNKKLNSKEKAIYKLIAVVLSVLLLLSSLLFTFASNFTVVGIAMEMGIVLDAFLMVLEKAYQMCRTR